MKRVLIVAAIIFVIIAAAGIGAVMWGRAKLAASLPQLCGVVTLDGVAEQVEIYRDKYGIPHIYARNRDDLMFAVGFVSAQDRLWQMDLTRRAATGHLAEIFGEDALKSDLLVRTLGLEQIAKRQLASLSAEGISSLTAFSNGVNACIEGLSVLPPEFGMLEYKPEPWRPEDSLAIFGLLAWQLSKNFQSEVVMMKLARKLGAGRAAELAPAYPTDGPFIIPEETTAEPLEMSCLEEGTRMLDEIIGSSGGSNSWVVGPSLTKNGAPILANDPHLSGTRMPSIWYYVHLVGGGYDTIGAIVPGTPLPLLGHNRRIGWGLTNMNADVQDLFIERLNPEDPNQYEYDGRWVDMDSWLERIWFRTREGDLSFIEKEVRRTIHGPIMNEVVPGVSRALALSWTGFEPTPEFDALAGINRAENWEEFCDALAKFGAAPQNFIYADIDGNIGYYGAGLVPVRVSGSGVFPRNGWASETMWKGWIPFKEMPSAFNPSEGYIATANNRAAGDDYKYFISSEWAPRFRSQRIAELIESKTAHDTESMALIQTDTRSLLAKLVCESVLPAVSGLEERKFREAADLLRGWDFDNTVDSVPAAIYHEFLIKFAKNTFSDEMGRELAGEYLDDYYLWIERFVQLLKEDSHWFDDVRTKEIEKRDDIAVRSFREAVESLDDRLGGNMSKWKWGRVHTVEFRHPLDRSRTAGMIFNFGPFPFPGDGESVNRGTFAFGSPYEVTMAASIRHIMDFSRLGDALGIYTTGQSSNPTSPHYHDFGDRWLQGEYIGLVTDKEKIIGEAEGDLHLVPAEWSPPIEKE